MDGVSSAVAYLIANQGVPADQILILVRSDFNGAWSRPLRESLGARGIPVVDVEQFRAPLATDEARLLLSLARIMVDDDDLAWWSLLQAN